MRDSRPKIGRPANVIPIEEERDEDGGDDVNDMMITIIMMMMVMKMTQTIVARYAAEIVTLVVNQLSEEI